MLSTDLQVVNGQNGSLPTREYSRVPAIISAPNLIQVQIDSFEHFKSDGLRELFDEISPIEDFPGGRFELRLGDHYFDEPKLTEDECRERETTFAAALHVTVQLGIKAGGPGGGEIKEQTLFIGDIPMMTKTGTFIINGSERVVVSQLVRSPGVYFTAPEDPNSGRPLAAAKLIPYRGAWMEFETSNRDVVSVKVDRKRKTPVSTLLRCLGYFYETHYDGDDADEMRRLFETNEGLISLFADVDTNPDHSFIGTTIEKDTAARTRDEALLEFYRRLRPGEPPNVENAKNLIENLFFNPRRYDLGRVGRYKLNRKLRPEEGGDGFSGLTLSPDDIVRLLKRMIRINNRDVPQDDIDHLENRRVRSVGELIQNQVRIGLVRMERVIKERMSTQLDPATTTPAALINIRPVVASVREFFGGSQLSQFMDQTNPLAELTHKRRLSALGPGGLSRERAGFEVRDVHHSHYGRICPIETPEGPNIGLLGSLATYARTNEYGFIETPYRRVRTDILNTNPALAGRELTEDVRDDSGHAILKAGGRPTRANGRLAQIAALSERPVAVRPYVSDSQDDIVYLAADAEESVHIAHAQTALDELGQFKDERVETRLGELGEDVIEVPPEEVEYMDVAPIQLVSVSTALIPFLEHDDANRALMGSNMQRQAVPLLRPEPPVVGTGMEERVAKDSGQVVMSDVDGEVSSIVSDRDGDYKVVVSYKDEDGETRELDYDLLKFVRSNQGTCLNHRPIVEVGDVVKKGDVIADSSSTGHGELALGQNVIVAFMSWEGYNFEDAIIISRRLVKDDKFTSIHIEKHEVESRDTKLGAEEITRDIPNVGDDTLRNLDEEGIIRVGAEINPGDILVGKITPKGETELSAEEKLLRAIFGEKARDVKDTSLRVPHGERGKIIDVKVLSRDNKDELAPGVNKLVRLWVAQTRKITEGDKMAGRHGNKGVVARILPEEDMPFLPDGTPVDIILTPLGVPSRMNLGQVLETHLGWAASLLGFKAVTPVFDGAKEVEIEDSLGEAWVVEKSNAVDPKNKAEQDAPPTINVGLVREWLAERGYDYDALYGTEAEQGAARKSALELWFAEECEVGWGVCTELDYLDLRLGEFLSQERERFIQGKRREWKSQGLAKPVRKELERKAGDRWDNDDKPKEEEFWRREVMPDVVKFWNGMTSAERSELSANLIEDGMIQESIRLNREHVAAPTIGKYKLRDGRSGEAFDRPVIVGQFYMMKLIHLVEDKIHARSTGPYSLITQQPLGGKAQFGGQRFGEMEVWALEAYSAAYNLQEMLTVKSDDVVGRVKTYEAIVKGEDVIQPGIPESFHVLLKELQSLGLAVELRYEEADDMGLDDLDDDYGDALPPYEVMDYDDMGFPETDAFPPGETVIDAEARPYDEGDDQDGEENGRGEDAAVFTAAAPVSDGADGDD